MGELCLFNEADFISNSLGSEPHLQSELILEPVIQLETIDGTKVTPTNLVIMYFWSEVHHGSMTTSNVDIEAWFNLEWSSRLMRVPSSLISLLSSDSSLPTLQFRVWIRIVDAENPSRSAVASAFDLIDITILANPNPGSCDLVPKPEPPQRFFAMETPVKVQCSDWIDPVDDTTVPSSNNPPRFRITLQLASVQNSLCDADSSMLGDGSGSVRVGEIVNPHQKLLSSGAVEVLLPVGCWSVHVLVHSTIRGLSKSFDLVQAFHVELPQESVAFTTDLAYFEWVLHREIDAGTPTIARVTTAAKSLLDSIKKDEASANNVDVSSVIRAVYDVVEQVGPSRDLIENQQLFDVAADAAAVRPSENVMRDVSRLLGQSLGDREQILNDLKDSSQTMINWDDAPLHRQVLNLKHIWQSFDRWVLHSANAKEKQEFCRRFDEAVSMIRQSMTVFWEAAALLQHYTDAVELHMFKDVRLTQSLKPDVGPIVLQSRHDKAVSSGIIGGLVPPDHSSRSLGLVTVAVPYVDVEMCRAPTNHHPNSRAESENLLSISTLSKATDTSLDPNALFFDRITLVLQRKIDADKTTANDVHNPDMLLKCVWYDSILDRWSPSGCATHAIRSKAVDQGSQTVVCECNHLTEFALRMYGTQVDTCSLAVTVDNAGNISNLYYIQHIGMLCVLACLEFLTLVNAVYSSSRVVSVNYSVKAVQNIVLLNYLLMMSSTGHLVASLAEFIFGFLYTTSQQGIWILAPILIGLRFALYSFFTTLVMTPLQRMNNLSGQSARVLFHSKGMMTMCCCALSFAVLLLAFNEKYVLSSVIVGFVSLIIAVVYVGIAYRCYSVLKSVLRGTTDQSSFNDTRSYYWIGRFLLSISVAYGAAHVCQSVMYLASVFFAQWYAEHLLLLRIIFKWADLITLGSSMVYVSRSIWTAHRRGQNNEHKHAVGILNRHHDVDKFYPQQRHLRQHVVQPGSMFQVGVTVQEEVMDSIYGANDSHHVNPPLSPSL